MPSEQGSVHVAASAESVWAIITDVGRMDEWVVFHRGVAGRVPRKVRVGTTFTQRVEVGGTDFEVEWEACEVEPSRRIVWEGCGPMGTTARSTYEIQEDAEGVRFSYCTEFDVPGGKMGALAARAVQSNSTDAANESLERLRQLAAAA